LQHPGSGAAVDADALAIGDEAVASGVRPGAAAGRRGCRAKARGCDGGDVGGNEPPPMVCVPRGV